MTDSENDIGAPRGEFITTLSGEDVSVPQRSMTNVREELFNEVIYGLDVLYRSSKMADYPSARGILFALDYVKAMKEVEG